MDYKIFTKKILQELGIQKKYKGCEYIISCVQYISENEDEYFPVTKILYVDVAKEFNTSDTCIERGIRNTIEKIWCKKDEEQDKLVSKIFGKYSEQHKPTNMQFLASLYDYMKLNSKSICTNKNFIFICPKTGCECNYCKNVFLENWKNLYYNS